jgi:hypothetical protein
MTIAFAIFFFFEYLPVNGRKRPKHVGGLPHACILLYLILQCSCPNIDNIFIVIFPLLLQGSREGSVGVATRYGLDGLEIESQWE